MLGVGSVSSVLCGKAMHRHVNVNGGIKALLARRDDSNDTTGQD